MYFFYVSRRQIYILAGHLERSMTQDFLQAEDISAVDQETHAESMSTGMGVQFRYIRHFFNPLEHLFYDIDRNWIMVFV
jgi:hypothetical protein